MTISKKAQNYLNNRPDVAFVVLITAIALILRAVAEVKAGIFPIGYDVSTSYLRILAAIRDGSKSFLSIGEIFGKHSLFYGLLQLLYPIFGGQALLLLKTLGVGLYIGLALSVYRLLRLGLDFKPRASFFICLIFILDLASLRLSWDLFRNELGMIFLFLFFAEALPILRGKLELKRLLSPILLLLLIYISHPLVFALAIILLGIGIIDRLTQNWPHRWLLIVGLYLVLFFLPKVPALSFSGIHLTGPAGLFERFEPIWLIWLIYAIYLPFIALGFKQIWTNERRVVGYWLMLVVVILGASLVWYPDIFSFWDRWILVLPLPVAVSVYLGIEQLSRINLFRLLGVGATSVLLIAGISFQASSFAFSRYGLSEEIPPHVSFPRVLEATSLGVREDLGAYIELSKLVSTLPTDSILVMNYRYRGIVAYWTTKSPAEIVFTTESTQEELDNLTRKIYDSFLPVYVFDRNKILDQLEGTAVLTVNGKSIYEIRK